jgi:protein TonB
MERPEQLRRHWRRFSPRNIAALSGALMLEAAAIYAIATALTFGGFQFFPHTVLVEFLKTRPPEVKPVVLSPPHLVKPPIPVVPLPEIQIQIPRPPPHIRVARMRPHPVMRVQVPVPVQTAAPPVWRAPPRPRGITAPVSIGRPHSCESEYPPMAIRLNQQGTTIINFTVNIDGSVSNVRIVGSSGHEMLDAAAIQCAWSWRYRPAFENGWPVRAPWTTSVHWRLQNAGSM